MTAEQVTEIWQGVLAKVRPYIKDGYLAPNEKGQLPELWPGYTRSCSQRRGIEPHVTHGVFPDELFASRAPNQTDTEWKWIKANYKQLTLPVFIDLENTVSRALHDRNWSLDFEDLPGADTVEDYLNKGIKEWGSLFNFIRYAAIRLKVSDAMGLVTFLPTAVPIIEQEDGTVVQDPDAEVKPEIQYHQVENVWGFSYDNWYLVRLNVNSPLDYYSGTKNTGVVCWLVDEEYVWSITQYGKPSDHTYRIEQWYRHGLGYPPAINWMGTPAVVNGSLLWESPYLAVKDVLDTALVGEHWLRASEAKCVYPHTVVVGSPCDYTDSARGAVCMSGKLTWTDGNGAERHANCPGCKGTGYNPRMSPLGQVVVNPSNDSTTQDVVNASNALAFVSPSTDTVEYQQSQFERRMKLARSIIHLDAEQPMAAGDAKTATEAGLNARAKDAFVKPIADQLFTVFRFGIECIGSQLTGQPFKDFTLRTPSTYDLRTDADHLAEISQAMTHGVHPSVIEMMQWEYVGSRYASDPGAMEAFEVIFRADRLQTMPAMTLTAEVAAGRVQPWELFLHYGALGLYEEASREPAWQRMDMTARVARLKEFALQRMNTQPVLRGPAARLAERMSIPPRGGAAVGTGDVVVQPVADSVQDTALNGAQVASLVQIINQVAVGVITPATARPMIKAAFPGMADVLITEMLSGIVTVQASEVQAVK